MGTASAGKKEFRIGLVLSQPPSRADDPGEYGAYLGLLRAKRQLNVQAKAVVPNPNVYFDAAPFDYLARQQYGLVFSTGYVGGLSEAARRFRNVTFVALDASRKELYRAPPNAVGTVFHSEQASYLAGFLAARMADKLPAPHVVSSVGGAPEPQVQALIAGFRAGARHADPKISLLNVYTNDFLNQARCAHAAQHQMARGSQVVFDVAGACGIGALEAAKRKGVYGIGVDTDQSYRGSFILTSVLKNLGLAVYDLTRLETQGRLRIGRDLSLDMLHSFVGLGRFSSEVPRSLIRRVRSLAVQIEKGEIVVPTTFSARR